MSTLQTRFLLILALLLAGIIAVAYWSEHPENAPVAARWNKVAASSSQAGNFLAGNMALRNNDPSAAALYINALHTIAPDEKQVAMQAFYLLLQNGQVEQAIRLTETSAKIFETEKTFVPLARTIGLVKKGEPAEALKIFTATIDKNTDKKFQYELISPLLKAWLLVLNNEPEKAMAEIGRLNRGEITKPFFHLHTALIHAMTGGNASEARQHLNALLTYKKELPVYFYLMTCHIAAQLDDRAMVEKAVLQLKRMAPEFTGVTTDIFLKSSWQYTAPDGLAEALTGIALVLNLPQNNDFALVYGRLSLFLNGRSDFTRLLVAEILDSLSRHQAALETLELIPSRSPFALQAQLHQADLYSKMHAYDKGIHVLSQALNRFHNNRDVYLEMAEIYRQKQDYQKALPVYNKTLSLLDDVNEKHWAIFYARGIVHERLGNWKAAEADLLKSIELNPDEPYVLNYLGYGWLERGLNKDKSIALIEKAVQLMPNSGSITDSLGWAYYLQQDYKRAVDLLEKAVALSPYEAVINDHLGDVYWRLGRAREARFQWQRAKNLDTNGEIKQNLSKKIAEGLDAHTSPQP